MPDRTIAPASPDSGATPFDSIRREDERGEYWSARELMPMYGYGADWRNFVRCIEQAKLGARNNGLDVEELFGDVTEKSGGRPRQSYRLTRHAAYLTAMEGDAAKPEIAAAKHYFASKTREAELADGKPMTEIEMARKYVAALEREQAISAELEVAKPKASKWDAYCNADGLIGMTELADILKTNVRTLTLWLVEIQFFRRQTSRFGGCRNMPRTTAQNAGYFCVKTEVNKGVAFPVAYATPRGVDVVVDAWERRVTEAAEADRVVGTGRSDKRLFSSSVQV
ncbi:phage antirepressor KilAC domain-containing protein [Actinomadura litoris]|uniref:phage antirepressor KilAC domain-containing protein n=1 Tax=Actinomadura litoris TaxID=2678616 RepID=UPI001FA733A6|nr:phage antirepressor KilAC domain-containing protein [Actinomadura litoris]